VTCVGDWPVGRFHLADLADVDQGLAALLTPCVAQVMPHGGPRVVSRLTARLLATGLQPADPETIDPRDIYPEAADWLEAIMMLALARAESPLAVKALLFQPPRWRAWLASGRPALTDEDRDRSRRLNRLLRAATVVLAGQPSVGKSTLSNALLGRAMSIASAVPGTTRDYITGRIDLGGIVVDWHDTPGIRASDDAIEQKAITMARGLIERADLLIAMRDHEHDWPGLPREPDLWVWNKCEPPSRNDRSAGSRSDPLRISALHASGLDTLASMVGTRLVSAGDIAHPGLWLFDDRITDG
jgi:tRNA U34 5-carboxymethylaminomethyl modifying GTPase MnmE/TrmE